MTEKEKHYCSYSRLRKYRGCRYDFYQHYIKGLRLRGMTMARMHIGTLGHAGLEATFMAHYLGHPQDDVIFEAVHAKHNEYIAKLGGVEELDLEYVVEVEALRDLAITATERAVEWLNLDRWEVVEVWSEVNEQLEPLIERQLIIPFPGFDGFLGYCDVVLREKSTGNVFLIDHKFREAFQSYENEETNEQFPIYQKLLAHFGIELSGVATFQVRTKDVAVPVMTKKGELSRKKISTTWEIYSQCIDACGFDPIDYEGVKEWATKVEFQRLTKNYSSPTTVENIWKNILATAAEMQSPTLPIYRNLRPGFAGCHNCDNRELCLAELRGGDTAWIIKNKYRHKSAPNTPLPVASDIIFEGGS